MNDVALAGIDARWRVLAVLALSLVVAWIPSTRVLAALFASALVVAVVSRPVPLALLGRRLAAVTGFIALIWLSLPWTLAGGRLAIDPAGVLQATLLTLRAWLIVLTVTLLLADLDAWRFARALAGLRMPAKLVQLLLLTARYLGLYAETRARIERAMRARGFRPRADRRTFEAYGQLIARLVALAFERARRVEWAMRARRYDASLHE